MKLFGYPHYERYKMKLIHTLTHTESVTTFKTYWDSVYKEYVTKVRTNNKHIENCDNFTDDKEDAIDTAKAMAQWHINNFYSTK